MYFSMMCNVFKATNAHQKSPLHHNLHLLLALLAAQLRVCVTGQLAHYPAQMDIMQMVIFFLLFLKCPSRFILFRELVALSSCCHTVHIFLLSSEDCNVNNS